MSTQTQPATTTGHATRIQRIAAAIDGRPEGRDAATLMQALASATGAEPMLVAVENDITMLLPNADWKGIRQDTMRMLRRTRDELAPEARTVAGRDTSIVRGLEQIVARDHRQLLVLGSSRRGGDQKITVGHITRQLIHDLACPIAVAPRGLASRPDYALRRVAVGFDGGSHAAAALALGTELAEGASAELHVLGVVDDRIPSPSWAEMWLQPFRDEWDKTIDDQVATLERQIQDAVADSSADVYPAVVRGVASQALGALSERVDVVVIGSRRWGVAARMLLGGTGEALARNCRAPLVIVPAPAAG